MTASWGAGRLATLCLLRGRGARGTIPTVWRRGLPRAAVIGRARRPAADVQPGVSPADDDRDILAHAVEVGGTDHWVLSRIWREEQILAAPARAAARPRREDGLARSTSRPAVTKWRAVSVAWLEPGRHGRRSRPQAAM